MTEPTVIANEYLLVFSADVEIPNVVNQSANSVEGASKILTSVDLSVNDVDSASYKHVYTITGLPGFGILLIDGNSVAVGSTFTGKDVVDGKVVYQNDGSNVASGTFQFNVRDAAGNTSSDSTFMMTLGAVYDEITAIELVDGASQRSTVDQVRVSFGELVDFDNGDILSAFSMFNKADNDDVTLVVDSLDESTGVTVVTLGFEGGLTRDGNSLVDGNYQLEVIGASFTIRGTSINGNDFSIGDNAGGDDLFYAHYGDSNGDRAVNIIDLFMFRQTYGKSTNDAGFNGQLDYNNDGAVNILDLFQFRLRYGTSL